MTTHPEAALSIQATHPIRRKRATTPQKSRTELAKEFADLPLVALAVQAQVAAYLNCSEAKLERDRWAGVGIIFRKVGRQIRYMKSDVLDYVSSTKRTSTTDTGRAA